MCRKAIRRTATDPVHPNCQPQPVKRPAVEIADIVRVRLAQCRKLKWFSPLRQKVARALLDCRTAALGGFAAQCDHCGATVCRYKSCRNRHCPKCLSLKQVQWVDKQNSHLLDTRYWHLVFTLPHALNTVALQCPRQIYSILFKAAGQTLLEFGRDPKWLGGQIGFTLVLHTWGQNLGYHIHVHAIVTGGALSHDRNQWLCAKHGFLFPVRALSKVFRGKYLDLLKKAHQQDQLRLSADSAQFDRLISELYDHDWVVYAKRPFNGPRQVVGYLGRYTHKIAISNHRLVSFDGQSVRFRWRDYADGNRQKIMQLNADEFLRRFFLHVLPHRFTRIRHYGLLGNRNRKENIAACRAVLNQDQPPEPESETTAQTMLRLTGVDITKCPHCKQGNLVTMSEFEPSNQDIAMASTRVRAPP